MRNSSQPLAQRALLVAVENPRAPIDAPTSLAELAGLCDSAGLEPVDQMWQRLPHPDPTHYVGKGKLEEVKERAALVTADAVVTDDELPPRAQKTLEDELGRQVIDRTTLILDIFAQRARSHEGRVQVELAQYEFLLPRLVGRGAMLSRLGGGIGTRGPGETRLEVDRRRVRNRISALKREINEIREHRRRSREQRRREALPVAGLVGYTNVGKSTLLTALTGSQAPAANAPFVTLDPLTRVMRLGSGQHVLVSDTVGFISKLPTTVVAAFRATLEELLEANVLIHVVDISDARAAERSAVVHDILREIGLHDVPMITAINKVDAASEVGAGLEAPPHPDTVLVSARTGLGLETLRGRIEEKVSEGMPWVAVRIPYDRSELVELFHRRGRATRMAYCPDGTEIEGWLPTRFLERLRPYLLARAPVAAR
ncbi:MAG: GTPase HflX [Chloroflexi bacterium]|nr:GTPase HflX [Chloroflexota bacterium]